jgi:hypothetical protein
MGVVPHEEPPDKKSEAKDAPPASGEKAGGAKWSEHAAATAAGAKDDGPAAKSAAKADHPGTASGFGHDLVCTPKSDSAPADKGKRDESELQKYFDPKALQKEADQLGQMKAWKPQTSASSPDGPVSTWHPPDVEADLDAMEGPGLGALAGMAGRYFGGGSPESLPDGARSGKAVDGLTGVVGGVVDGRANKMQAEPQKDEATERPPR